MRLEWTLDALHRQVTATFAVLPSRALILAAPPIRIQICSDSAWVIATLTDLFKTYLAAQFSSPDHSASAETVHVLIDPGLASRLESVMAAANNVGGMLHGRQHMEASDLHVAERQAGAGAAHGTCHVVWSDEAPSTALLVLPKAGAASARLLLRAVRAIASRMLLQAGWIPLHAAGAATREGAVCFIGRRGGGKTTALLGMLATGAGYLANDLLFLVSSGRDAHAAWSARALPTAVSIRRPTVGHFPTLAALTQHAAELHCENSISNPNGNVERLFIPSVHLATAFGVATIPIAALRALVVVDYQGEDRPSRWQPLAVADALPRLRSHYLDRWFTDEEHEMTRLGGEQDRLRHDHQQGLVRLAAGIPAAVFQPGGDAAATLQRGITELLG